MEEKHEEKGYCVLKWGKINNVNTKGQAKVFFAEDGITSAWLPLSFRRTLNDKEFDTFDINEFVACIMDSNLERGIIIGAAYVQDSSLPDVANSNTSGRQFADGTKIYYDKSAHKYYIKMAGGGNFNISSSGIFTFSNGSQSLGSLLTTLRTALETFCTACAGSTVDPVLAAAATELNTSLLSLDTEFDLLLG